MSQDTIFYFQIRVIQQDQNGLCFVSKTFWELSEVEKERGTILCLSKSGAKFRSEGSKSLVRVLSLPAEPSKLFHLPKQNVDMKDPILFVPLSMEKYGFCDGDIVAAQQIDAKDITLDHVFLLPIDNQWNAKKDLEMDLSFKKSLLSEVFLIRKEDQIKTTIINEQGSTIINSFKVADTFPLRQGVLTADTTVVILDNYSKEVVNSVVETKVNEKWNEEPLILSSSLLPDFSTEIDVAALQVKICFLGDFLINPNKVGVSLETLKRLRMFDSSWFLIRTSTGEEHLSEVVCLDSRIEQWEEGIAYLSPTLAFNLKIDPTEENMQTIALHPYVSSVPKDSKDTNRSLPIPVAAEVQVSRVKSPTTSGYMSYTKKLAWFFQEPKVVKEGDIFAIPIQKESPLFPKHEIDNSDSEDEIDSSELTSHHLGYFKVMSISPNDKFLVIDKRTTKLFQKGAVHSRIPSLPSIPAGLSTAFRELEKLLKPCLHAESSIFGIRCSILLRGPQGCGKASTVRAVAQHLGIHVYDINCFQILGQMETQTEQELREVFKRSQEFTPCVLLLRNIDALEKTAQQQMMKEPRSVISNVLRDCLAIPFQEGLPVLVIGTTNAVDSLSTPLRGCFRQEIVFETPDETQRIENLAHLLQKLPFNSNVSIKELGLLTASLTRQDLYHLCAKASLISLERFTAKSKEKLMLKNLLAAGILLNWSDLEQATTALKSKQSTNVIKIPKVSWEDVGGLADVKNEILDTIQLPLQHPNLFAEGLQHRSGVLLYGPPGTGKTLIAKAVATEFSLNFLSVKGPELINMYVGESEKNVRDLFQKARSARPCVIFFDELDSLAPNRGKGSDSGGVMDRIVSQLLAELDGLQKSADVFVIGATNRPDLVDPALLRPGRFDRLAYLGVSEDHASQLKIIRALTRKFQLGSSVSLEKIVEKCPLNLTGADFYALCSDALLMAITDQIAQYERSKELSQNSPTEMKPGVVVEQVHFQKALQNLTPSVSEEELKHYKRLQAEFAPKK